MKTRLTFKEACLLDVSGELAPAAREKFAQYLRENPSAALEYHDLLDLFESTRPAPQEFSAHQRLNIPPQIKAAIAGELLRQKLAKQAKSRQTFIRYAFATVSAAAAMLLLAALILPALKTRAHDRAQFAAINRAVDTLAATSDLRADAQRSEVEASIRELETESPTLAQLHAANFSNLIDALTSLQGDADSPEF